MQEIKDFVPRDILISLHTGYGLGDGVQMSAVLRHVAKYRPHWRVDYRADEGRHQVGRGLVEHTFAHGAPSPRDHYDAEVQICLYDTWANWGDRPNTRVSAALHDYFDLGWDAECGRYQVQWSRDTGYAVQAAMSSWTAKRAYLTTRPVGLHYMGDSSQTKKNLSHAQAANICDAILGMWRCPLVLDWRGECLAGAEPGVCTTWSDYVPQGWGARADTNCAIISQCEAFVGIDSGPGKCAGATDTPSLIVWTGHHPAPFYDPAPNVTHLVPRGYHGLEPVCNDAGVIRWFEEHYNVRQYDGDPVADVKRWLEEVLK